LIGRSPSNSEKSHNTGASRAESAALLVDEVFPERPIRQWVLSFPYPLRFLFATRPVMHVKAGYSCKTAQSGAVTLIQRFGSALNLNIYFHMIFLDGAYVERSEGSVGLRWVKAPTSAELTRLAQSLAQRIGCFLERDAENGQLAGEGADAEAMDQLLGHSITYRIAVGRQQGRKVFTARRRCPPAMSRSVIRWARWPGSRSPSRGGCEGRWAALGTFLNS